MIAILIMPQSSAVDTKKFVRKGPNFLNFYEGKKKNVVRECIIIFSALSKRKIIERHHWMYFSASFLRFNRVKLIIALFDQF